MLDEISMSSSTCREKRGMLTFQVDLIAGREVNPLSVCSSTRKEWDRGWWVTGKTRGEENDMKRKRGWRR